MQVDQFSKKKKFKYQSGLKKESYLTLIKK